MKILSHYLVGGLLIAACLVNSAYADTELENAALTRIVTVLNSLTPLINEAISQQDKTTRVQFQYDALQADINKIKSGIAEKLQVQTIEPRVVTPIQGDYLIQRGKHT
jgi:RAQPRD family integrative conjugative element protein